MGRRENRGLRLPSQAAPHALEFLAFIGARNHRQADKHCVNKEGDYIADDTSLLSQEKERYTAFVEA